MVQCLITIDGPSASGKGTLSRLLCEKYGFSFLDTGAYFRSVALRVREEKVPEHDMGRCIDLAETITEKDLEDPAIREESVAQLASRLSVHPEIRERFRRFCRASAARLLMKAPGLVVDGRDAGTVLFPEAPVKLFLLVRADERARRRYEEYKAKGQDLPYQEIYEGIVERDKRDQNRASDPLRPALDAHILDVSDKTKGQVLEIASSYVDAFLNHGEKNHAHAGA